MGGKRLPASEIIGKRFGRLTGVGPAPSEDSFRWYFFRCDCGTEKAIRVASVASGAVKSCGCLKRELDATLAERGSVTHGDCRSGKRAPEYGVYRTMLSRCYNPNVERYSLYGGRGIEVCERWRGLGGYERFLADMGRRPRGCSIERIDSDGPYAPQNCRWATPQEQSNNTARNRLIEMSGRKQTLAQWAREIGIKPITIHMRLKSGWSVRDALTRPLRGRG